MFGKYLISLLVLCMVFGSFSVVFAGGGIAKLKNEKSVPICSELFLKKGTIIRATNVAFLTENPTTSPKYTTKYTGNDQLVFLTEDTQVYLTDGGYIVKRITFEKYLKKLSEIGINIKTINIY